MMKRILWAGLALGVGLGVSSLQTAHADSTGCGLGTTIFKGQSGVVPQVLAVTTNGTSGNQTFGITTGTLGCESNDTVASAEVRQFAAANIDHLARDVARGEGETLVSFATAMQVDPADRSLMFATLKDNFTVIFPDQDVSVDEVLVSIHEVMAQDARLARYVAA